MTIMSKILTSIHGHRLGLTQDGYLIGKGLKGIRTGDEGALATFGNPANVVRFLDDFLGDVIADQWNAHLGTDNGTGAATAIAINAAIGGTLRLTTGDSNASLAADGVVLDSALNWKAAQGNLTFEARVKVDVITGVQIFVGLTDQVSALEMPVTLSGTTFTTVATDAVGFLFDTSADTDTIRLVGVANDVDATHQDSGLAFVAATYKTLRVEVDTAGKADFYIDGVKIGSTMTGAVTPSVALTPVIGARSLNTTSKNVDVDYILIEANRA